MTTIKNRHKRAVFEKDFTLSSYSGNTDELLNDEDETLTEKCDRDSDDRINQDVVSTADFLLVASCS